MITTKDLANICGVSRTTIDRALNGKDQIRAETRDRILRIARENGYRPDLLARTLVKGKSMSIGVVVFNVRNQYFSAMLGAIQQEANRRGYFVYCTFSDNDPQKEIMLVNDLIDRRVDGIIVCPVNRGQIFSENFGNAGIPIVTISNRLSARWHHVGIDDAKAVRDGLNYILSSGRGYERFIFVCPPYEKRRKENIYAQQRRVEGFRSFFKKAGTSYDAMVIGSSDYRKELIDALRGSGKKTAVFCSSDVYALEILKLFRQENVGILPERVGLISFDKTDAMDYICPKLTAVDSAVTAQSVLAVDTLLNLIAGTSQPCVQNVKHAVVEGDTI